MEVKASEDGDEEKRDSALNLNVRTLSCSHGIS